MRRRLVLALLPMLGVGCAGHARTAAPADAVTYEFVATALNPELRALQPGELEPFLAAHRSRVERLAILVALSGLDRGPSGPREWAPEDVAAVDAACDLAEASGDAVVAARYARARARFQVVEPGGLRGFLADGQLDPDARLLAIYWSGRHRGVVTSWPPEDVDAVLTHMAPVAGTLGPGGRSLIWVIAGSDDVDRWRRPNMPPPIQFHFLAEIGENVLWHAAHNGADTGSFLEKLRTLDSWIQHVEADPVASASPALAWAIGVRCQFAPPPTGRGCPEVR